MEDSADEVYFMQASTSERLRNEWGNMFCHHPMVDTEYRSGSKTGNFACLICGATFSVKKLFLAFYFIFLLINYSQLEVLEVIKIVFESF